MSINQIESVTWTDLIRQGNFGFCEGKETEDLVVRMLTERVFGLAMASVLHKRYELMRHCFRDERCNPDKWQQDQMGVKVVRDDSVMLAVSGDYYFQNHPIKAMLERYFNCGHDLPVWTRIAGSMTQRRYKVMIVGQDPMRNDLDHGDVYLSSPWALHSVAYKKRALSKARNFVAKMIADMACDVYLTDFAKYFFTDAPHYDDIRQSTPIADDRITIQSAALRRPPLYAGAESPLLEVLKEEIKLWEPDLVITFGEKICNQSGWPVAFNACDYTTNPDNVRLLWGKWPYMSLYHPNAWWSDEIEERCGSWGSYFSTARQTAKAILKNRSGVRR